MGLNLYVALDPPVPGLNPNANDRTVLAKSSKAIDTLARSIGIAPLSAFYSYGLETLADIADDETIEQMRASGHVPTWYIPQAGLDTVRALRDRLHDPAVGSAFDVAQAVRELEDLERILMEADKNGVKFRLFTAF